MIKFKKKALIVVASWFFMFFFIFNMFHYFQPFRFALINTSFVVFSIMSMFYFTSLYLFPKFYRIDSRKYLWVSISAVFIFALIFLLIDIYLVPEFRFEDKDKPPLFFHYFRLFTTLGFSYFVSTSLSLMEKTTQMQQSEKVLLEEKLETELKLLKAQINPHFIFNALNNIYSLTYLKSQNAPESILKLSEMLRYVFYDCSKDKVPLSSELNYVENFISFQQMKSEHVQNISLESNMDSQSVEMAPMILIPFIENAFKYSRIEEIDTAYVKMKIIKKDSKVHFEISNSIPETNKMMAGSGLGIPNVEHRLKIIYPEKSNLIIDAQKDSFKVDLVIEV